MAQERSGIPLADVLRAANELVSAGLIKDYALGGALAAIYYTEPFTTYHADIIFIPGDETLTGIPAIYSHLQSKGCRIEHEPHCSSDWTERLPSLMPEKAFRSRECANTSATGQKNRRTRDEAGALG
jgi:hypothetical protein